MYSGINHPALTTVPTDIFFSPFSNCLLFFQQFSMVNILILLTGLSIMLAYLLKGSGLQKLILRPIYKLRNAVGQFNKHLMLIN